MYSSIGRQAVPMDQGERWLASAGVEAKLEAEDRLKYRAASDGNILIFQAAWYKMMLETLKSGSPQGVGSTLRAYDE